MIFAAVTRCVDGLLVRRSFEDACLSSALRRFFGRILTGSALALFGSLVVGHGTLGRMLFRCLYYPGARLDDLVITGTVACACGGVWVMMVGVLYGETSCASICSDYGFYGHRVFVWFAFLVSI